MALTRTEDKTDKAITRLLMQSPLGLTIGDITAAAKCTPQTARKSLARIGADKDASGMLYVLRDDEPEQDTEAAPGPEQAAPEPAPEAQMPKSSEVWIERWGGCGYMKPATSPTEPTDQAPAASKKPKPIRRGDLVEYDGRVCVVFSDRDLVGHFFVSALSGVSDYYHCNEEELTRIGSIRKKVKRLKAAIAKAGGES